MFKVHVRWPNGNLSEFLIDKKEFFLGRDQANDVYLPSDKASRKHAKVFERNGEVFIEDLESANGTFIKQRKITAPEVISSKDPVKMADVFLRVFYKANVDPKTLPKDSGGYSLAQRLGNSRQTTSISGDLAEELRKQLIDK